MYVNEAIRLQTKFKLLNRILTVHSVKLNCSECNISSKENTLCTTVTYIDNHRIIQLI